METFTTLNSIRLAPRKVRAVSKLIKGKDVSVAREQLEHLIKKPSLVFLKLLKSAVDNAENNFRMVEDNLFISNIIVDEGIKLKRFMPRAQGRATEIQKKTSKITIVLDERVAGMKHKAAAKKAKEEAQAQPQEAEQTEADQARPAPKAEIRREIGKKPGFIGNLKKRLFQRKSV